MKLRDRRSNGFPPIRKLCKSYKNYSLDGKAAAQIREIKTELFNSNAGIFRSS